MASRSLTALAAAGVCAAAPAAAAPPCMLCAPAPPAAAKKPPPGPVTIQVETGIDFSRVALISAGQGGSVTVDPRTGQRTVTGSLQDLQGLPFQGSVTVRGAANSQLEVLLPASVTLSTTGGGTIQLSAITTDLKPNPRTDHTGTLRFSIGGRLMVDGNSYGDFRGTIPITVDYR